MLKIFDFSKEKEFASAAAADIAKRYPVALSREPGQHQSVTKLTRIIEDICMRAIEFKKTHPMGWLRKAKLCNNFRWELIELGYKKEFAEFATEALVVYLSRSKEK